MKIRLSTAGEDESATEQRSLTANTHSAVGKVDLGFPIVPQRFERKLLRFLLSLIPDSQRHLVLVDSAIKKTLQRHSTF